MALAALAPHAVAMAQPDGSLTIEQALALTRADEQRRIAVFDQAAAAVVAIFPEDGVYAGGGSGVVIDPRGYGLTNFHVVSDFIDSRRGVGGMADGKLYPLRVLGIDPGGDLAMFKLEGREAFPAVSLGDSTRLRLGAWVAAMGNPFALSEDYKPTITLGIVSGLNRYQAGQGNFLEYADCIQVSTSINPGNSGGPLFDLDGRVMGINGRASFEERGRVNVGLGYAISARQIERFLPSLRAGYLCEHANLGMQVGEIGDAVVVRRVQPLTAAERAGLEVGDALLAIDDTTIRTANEYNNAVALLPADWPIELTVRRGDQTRRVAVRVDRLPLDLPNPYVLDIGHNLAEMRAQFAVWRAVAGVGGPSAATVSRAGAALARLVIRDGAITVAEPDQAEEDTWVGLLDEDAATLEELATIVTPLVAEVRDELRWGMARGTAIDGRVARVNEHRGADGITIVRWYFAEADQRFTQARVFDGDALRAVWTREVLGNNRERWTRTSSVGVVTPLDLQWLPAGAAESPATDEAGDQP